MAVDMFLKIDGIEGESQDSTRSKEIQLLSCSWGMTQVGSNPLGGGGGSGKVSMQDVHFVCHFSKASPKLQLACATGEHIKTGILTFRKAGGDKMEYLKYTFSDLLVSSYQTGASSGGDEHPTEQISFNFAKYEVEYKEQKADGSLGGQVKAGYDLKANKKV